ncbi:hypothetical protein RKD54_003941 [Pseudarthrobacter sp. SLBN-100]
MQNMMIPSRYGTLGAIGLKPPRCQVACDAGGHHQERKHRYRDARDPAFRRQCGINGRFALAVL